MRKQMGNSKFLETAESESFLVMIIMPENDSAQSTFNDDLLD